jgi:hypothetical protein
MAYTYAYKLMIRKEFGFIFQKTKNKLLLDIGMIEVNGGTDKIAPELKVLPTLVWKDGDIDYSISGDLTEDYLKKVAESMINGK